MNKEDQNIEYKQSWHDEYLKWICGFANAQGGKLIIGIDDHGAVVGVANAKKLLEDIPNKIRDTMGIVGDVALLRKNGKNVIRVKVKKSLFPVCYRGEYHYRSGGRQDAPDRNGAYGVSPVEKRDGLGRSAHFKRLHEGRAFVYRLGRPLQKRA